MFISLFVLLSFIVVADNNYLNESVPVSGTIELSYIGELTANPDAIGVEVGYDRYYGLSGLEEMNWSVSVTGGCISVSPATGRGNQYLRITGIAPGTSSFTFKITEEGQHKDKEVTVTVTVVNPD